MVATVEFDHQAGVPKKHICPTQKGTLPIANLNLNLRTRETGEQEEHSEPGLHCRFSVRLGQVDNAPEPGDAFPSAVLRDVSAQLCDGDERGVKRHIGGNDSLCQ